MKFPRQNLFWTMAFAPFALLVTIAKKLPPKLSGASLASLLAGVAAGTGSLGVIFILFDFGYPADPDPNLIIFLLIATLLLIVHGAMVRAEASAANYVIGRGASASSRWRPYFATAGALLGHLIWWIWALPYIHPTDMILRDEFSNLFLWMILPSAFLAAPLSALGALLSPAQR